MSHTEPERGGRRCPECGELEGHHNDCSQAVRAPFTVEHYEALGETVASLGGSGGSGKLASPPQEWMQSDTDYASNIVVDKAHNYIGTANNATSAKLFIDAHNAALFEQWNKAALEIEKLRGTVQTHAEAYGKASANLAAEREKYRQLSNKLITSDAVSEERQIEITRLVGLLVAEREKRKSENLEWVKTVADQAQAHDDDNLANAKALDAERDLRKATEFAAAETAQENMQLREILKACEPFAEAWAAEDLLDRIREELMKQ